MQPLTFVMNVPPLLNEAHDGLWPLLPPRAEEILLRVLLTFGEVRSQPQALLRPEPSRTRLNVARGDSLPLLLLHIAFSIAAVSPAASERSRAAVIERRRRGLIRARD